MRYVNLYVKILLLLFLFTQCVIICMNWDFPLHDDAYYYVHYAQECINNNTWYPAVHNMYDGYIFAPGYVNLLIFLHQLSDNFNVIKIVNLFLNIVLLYEVYYIASRIFNKQIGLFSLLLYMITYSNIVLPITPLSDLPFLFCMVSAVYLVLKNKWYYMIGVGVLIALGNWIRPLAVIYLVTIVAFMLLYKYKWRQYVLLALSLFVTVFIIGKTAENRIGNFVFQSTTSGVNLAMSACDKATGLMNKAFEKDPYYAEFFQYRDNYTYQEKDKKLKELSISWILNHPWKYVRQIPIKIAGLYSMDTWPDRVLPNSGLSQELPKAKGSFTRMTYLIGKLFLKSIVFYGVLFFFLVYVWRHKKQLFQKDNVFLLVPLLGTAVTIIFVVLDRYHYPFMPFIIMYASAAIYERYFLKKENA